VADTWRVPDGISGPSWILLFGSKPQRRNSPLSRPVPGFEFTRIISSEPGPKLIWLFRDLLDKNTKFASGFIRMLLQCEDFLHLCP
jgi:hypothetical protein